MTYTYYDVISNHVADTPKQEMLDMYQAEINHMFEVATDLFTVQEEDVTDHTFSSITVRLNSVYGDSSSKLGDDFRKVIFKDITHQRALGTKFIFDNGSTWLTINYDEYGKPTASIVVHKCRNVMKWIDKQNGAILSEPCVFDYYQDQRARPTYNKFISVPDGYTGVIVQRNDNTQKIAVNDRFYFNGICYKVWNIYRVLSNPTEGVPPVLYMFLGVDEINAQRDNIELGIANYNDYNYSISIDQSSFEGLIGATGTLSANVMFNTTEEVTRDIVWSTSDDTIVSVNNSTGVYELLALGSATITATLSGNTNVTATINVSVVSSVTPNYSIIINPEERVILLNDAMDLSIYRYNNDVQMEDVFTYTASGANEKCYTIDQIDGNNLRIYNNQKSSTKLTLVFHDTTSSTSDTTVVITLGGVF